MDWSTRKGESKTKPKSNKGTQGKGYTAEEASLPETETQDSQWQETVDTSQHETWQADGSGWSWTVAIVWEESKAHYQDWANAQDWQSQSSWLAVSIHVHESETDTQSRASGMPCRVSGQVADHLGLFVQDVTQHSFLTTKNIGSIDLSRNPTYVISDLGCTKSMGSRYAVNKFMRAASAHGFEYELMPSTSKFSLAKSETTSAHQALTIWFPTKPPMFTIVDIVEQGRVPILFSLQQMQTLNITLDMRPDKVLITCEALGLHHVQATQASSSHIVIDLAAILRVPARASCSSDVLFPVACWRQ